jgi:TP53 regulating kinase and related kinases
MPSNSKSQIIAQGAEAILIKQGKLLKKDRIKKSYRHPALDSMLRNWRTRHESKIMEKTSKIIPVPNIIKTTEHEIDMDFIEGERLSTSLDSLPEKKALEICRIIGQQVSKLHQANIIHGDLTTSNMILREDKDKDKIYFIDFGLSFHSPRIEDKAVDLHLIKQAFESKHFKKSDIYLKNILEGYKQSNPQALLVLKQLEKVESRGRYKNKH